MNPSFSRGICHCLEYLSYYVIIYMYFYHV
nr:MAG TPA: hypothetical protein [Caudoviricetes sp.]